MVRSAEQSRRKGAAKAWHGARATTDRAWLVVLLALAVTACRPPVSMANLVEGMAPSLGPDRARAVVVEFGDYQCHHCAVLGRRLRTLARAGTPEFRLIYRHTPSRYHPAGRQAALVAAAAAELGQFWELHWQLVTEGPIQEPSQVWEIAENAGLPLDDLRTLLRSGLPEQRVAQDVALADRLRLRGLPTLFVAGRRLEGALSHRRLRSVIAAAAQ